MRKKNRKKQLKVLDKILQFNKNNGINSKGAVDSLSAASFFYARTWRIYAFNFS